MSEGYLYLTDRASNLIISGGVNIYPQEIEDVLAIHPDLVDAAVLGVPDPEMGEQVKAVIQVSRPSRPTVGGGPGTRDADPGQETADPEESARALADPPRRVLPRGAGRATSAPRSFEFTAEELRTPVGKIRRGPLRERFGAGPGPYHPHR